MRRIFSINVRTACSPPRTDPHSEAGVGARIWLRLCEVFGLDWDFLCVHVVERGMAATAFGYTHVSGYHKSWVSVCIWAANGICCIYICAFVCEAGWVTVWNFQKIPAEIILGHECVFIYVASKWWSSVYLKDLAVKCVSSVRVWLLGPFFFFAMWGKTTTASVLAMCVEFTHTGSSSDVWPGVSVCVSAIVAEIQQCLAVSNSIYDSSWPSVCAVWVCVRNRD